VSVPKSVRVGPHRYQIVVSRSAIDAESAKDGERKLGSCDAQHCRIVVEPDQAPSQLRDTVVHELLHACFDLIGGQEDVSHDVEEKLVRRLAPILVGVLQANPRLVEWVAGSDE